MSQFDDMIRGLREDLDVPDGVWERYTDTLEGISGKPGAGKRRFVKYGTIAAAIMAAVCICHANPVLAAKIPILGKIFQEVQEFARFSGEYSEKAEVLTDEAGAGDEGCAAYTAEDAGVKITASEIYCDGLSVFLTAEVEMEQGGLEQIAGNSLYLGGNWEAAGMQKRLENHFLEGKAVDDHTFIGMLKLDLEQEETGQGTVILNLDLVGYDDRTPFDVQDLSAAHTIQGAWRFSLPFTVDAKVAGAIEVGARRNGYGIDHVWVSPYQVVVYKEVPYTEKEMTREQFEEMMREKTGGKNDPGITYEEYMETQGRSYKESLTVIFNQDGEMLKPMEEYSDHGVWAVQEMDISQLHIYVFDAFSLADEAEAGGAGSAVLEQAAVSAVVNVQ